MYTRCLSVDCSQRGGGGVLVLPAAAMSSSASVVDGVMYSVMYRGHVTYGMGWDVAARTATSGEACRGPRCPVVFGRGGQLPNKSDLAMVPGGIMITAGRALFSSSSAAAMAKKKRRSGEESRSQAVRVFFCFCSHMFVILFCRVGLRTIQRSVAHHFHLVVVVL